MENEESASAPTAEVNPRRPLIVVKRVYFNEFASGIKTIEYRRHRPPYTRRTFSPGREVRIAWTYNIKRCPKPLLARAESFDVCWASETPPEIYAALGLLYPGLQPDAEIAVISLKLINGE